MIRCLLIFCLFATGITYSLENNIDPDWDMKLIEKKLQSISDAKIENYALLAWYSLHRQMDSKKIWISDSVFLLVQIIEKNNEKKWMLVILARSPRKQAWYVFVQHRYISWNIFQKYYDHLPNNVEIYNFLEEWPWEYDECNWELSGSVMTMTWNSVIGTEPQKTFKKKEKECSFDNSETSTF